MSLLLLLGNPPPSIVSQPQDVSRSIGQTATFTVVARDAKTYQWSVSSDGGSFFEELPAATTTAYTTAPVVFPDDNDKRYRVTVRSPYGTAISRAAVLTVGEES